MLPFNQKNMYKSSKYYLDKKKNSKNKNKKGDQGIQGKRGLKGNQGIPGKDGQFDGSITSDLIPDINCVYSIGQEDSQLNTIYTNKVCVKEDISVNLIKSKVVCNMTQPIIIDEDVCITGELNVDAITSKQDKLSLQGADNSGVEICGDLCVDTINNKTLNEPITINSDVCINGSMEYTNQLKNVIHFRGAIDNTTTDQYLSYVGESGFAFNNWSGLFMPVQNIQFTDITVKLNNNTIGDDEIQIDLEKGCITNTVLSSVNNETYDSSSFINIYQNNLYKHTDLTTLDLCCLDNECFGIKVNITPNTATINSNIIVSVHYITKKLPIERKFIQLGNDIDGETANDESGFSVSLSNNGTIIAIGARLNDDNGSNSGHVRIYEYNGTNWNQIGQDIDGKAIGDYFGRWVSLSSDGKIVAIGAPLNNDNGVSSGHVRVYEYDGAIWNQLGNDIIGEATEDQSGLSVSLSSDGTIVAIGGPRNDDNGVSSGHVRVYEYDGAIWNQIGQDIDGEAAFDNSARSISLSSDGKIVAIGATLNDGNGGSSGHVRVYEYNGTNWNQIGQDIDGEASNDKSGHSVSLSSDGTIVAIGAVFNDGNGSDSGHVRVYEYNNMTLMWNQLGQDIDGEEEEDQSGYSVSLSSDGTIVAIGAILNDGNGGNSGHVRVYKYDSLNNVWEKIGNDIDGEAANDQSGYSVSLSCNGTIVAIGAILNESSGLDSGHVRIYQLI